MSGLDHPRIRVVALAALASLTALHVVLGKDMAAETEAGGLTLEEQMQRVLVEGEDRYSWLTAEARSALGTDDGSSVAQKMAALHEFDAPTMVDVQLVGFEGDGNGAVEMAEHKLERHLEMLRMDRVRAHVMHPDDELDRGGRVQMASVSGPHKKNDHNDAAWSNAARHDLAVRHKLMFRVRRAPRELTARINKLIDDHVVKRQESFLPVSLVDDIIRADYTGSQRALSYSIYILNPHLGAIQHGDSSITPVYWYLGETDRDRCGINLWVGTERYVWLDITAGPATLGPRTSGTGVVLEDTLPRLQARPHHGAFGHGVHGGDKLRPQEGFTALVAAFVQRAAQHLIIPTAAYFPIPYTSDITIHLVVIVEGGNDDDDDDDDAEEGGDGDDSDAKRAAAVARAEAAATKRWAPYVAGVEAMALPGQTVNVVQHRIPFDDCELCVSSLAHALRSHTSMSRGSTLGTHVHEFIDALEMARWLRHFDDNFWGLQDGAAAGQAIYPVFVFELTRRTPLLLDRFHQALSFRDMVVAVSTDVRRMLLDMECNGNHLTMPPKHPMRAALAATLQTVWGVAPPQQRWDPLRHRIETDYTWAVGKTPFGPFSGGSFDVSFAPRDAAARVAVFSDINATIEILAETLRPFTHTGKLLSEIMPQKFYRNFVERWNFLRSELDRAAHFLSVHNFNRSLFHSQSVRRDAAAMADLLVAVARDRLGHRVDCTETRHTGDTLFTLHPLESLTGGAVGGVGGGGDAGHHAARTADKTLGAMFVFALLGMGMFCYGQWLRRGLDSPGTSAMGLSGLRPQRKLQYFKDAGL